MAMKEGLIGRKRGMTQVFGDDGNRIPVTVIEAGPCTVVGLRTASTHGYDALQIGFQPEPKKARVICSVCNIASDGPPSTAPINPA